MNCPTLAMLCHAHYSLMNSWVRCPIAGDLRHQTSLHHGQGAADHLLEATHFLMKTLPRVATEMALHVLAYNLTRVMNILGPGPLMTTIGRRQSGAGLCASSTTTVIGVIVYYLDCGWAMAA